MKIVLTAVLALALCSEAATQPVISPDPTTQVVRHSKLPPFVDPAQELKGLVERLREAPMPVVARLFDDGLWLDVRTLADDEIPLVAASFASAFR